MPTHDRRRHCRCRMIAWSRRSPSAPIICLPRSSPGSAGPATISTLPMYTRSPVNSVVRCSSAREDRQCPFSRLCARGIDDVSHEIAFPPPRRRSGVRGRKDSDDEHDDNSPQQQNPSAGSSKASRRFPSTRRSRRGCAVVGVPSPATATARRGGRTQAPDPQRHHADGEREERPYVDPEAVVLQALRSEQRHRHEQTH